MRAEAIADKLYVLPVRSEVRLRDMKHMFENRIEFKNYQKFGTEMTMHYDEKSEP